MAGPTEAEGAYLSHVGSSFARAGPEAIDIGKSRIGTGERDFVGRDADNFAVLLV